METQEDTEQKTLNLFHSFLSELIKFNPDNEDLKTEIQSLTIKLVYAAPEVKEHVFFNGCNHYDSIVAILNRHFSENREVHSKYCKLVSEYNKSFILKTRYV